MLKGDCITVGFGKPVTAPALVPVYHKSTPMCINDPFMVNGTCYNVTAMSLGTPHGAVFVDDLESVDVNTLGAALGTHVLFPKGASIVFVQMTDGESLKARVWQSGAGESGFNAESACVAGTAAMMLQKSQKHEVGVDMGGHRTRVKWDRSGGDVYLTGPSALVGN